MSNDLVEQVAQAIEQSIVTARLTPAGISPYTPEATAAIRVVLEEAAKVPHFLFNADGTPPERRAAKEIAAAIRSMMPEQKP